MYPEYEQKKKVNGGSVARIVIWSVVLVILVGVLVFGLLFNGEWSLQGINIGSYHYDDADYSVGSGSTREIVTDLEVFWPAGEVSVVPSTTDEVVITEGFEATVDSISGSVSVDGFENVTKTRDECRYGDGRVRIEVDAVSGSIKIAKSVAD